MCASRLSVRGRGEDRGSPFDARPPARHISPRYRFRGFLTFWRMNRGFLMDLFDASNEKNPSVKNHFFVLISNLFPHFSDTPPPPDTRANSRNLIEIEGFLINCCKINTFYTLDFKSVGWNSKLPFFCYYLPSYEENSFIKI